MFFLNEQIAVVVSDLRTSAKFHQKRMKYFDSLVQTCKTNNHRHFVVIDVVVAVVFVVFVDVFDELSL